MLTNPEASQSPGEQDLLAHLRQSLALLRVAFDSTDEMMLITDHQRRIQWANQKAADCFGTGAADVLVGKTLEQCIQWQPLDQNKPSNPFDQQASTIQTEAIFTCSEGEQQLRIIAHNKRAKHTNSFTGRLSWRQIKNRSDTFLLIIIRDLDPIEQSLHRQRTFIQSLAHELRTPLALLAGNLMRVCRLIETSDPARLKLETAQQETRRLGRLVDKLMLMSDLETGCYPWTWEIVSLDYALHSWQQTLNRKKRAHLTIRPIIQSNQPNPLIRIDKHAFCLAMGQLFENSLHFSDGKASIVIDAETTDDHLIVHFQDSGPGIKSTDQDQIMRIFERFQRLEQHRTSHRVEGGGLGLALAKDLIEGMGGTLQLATPSPGAPGTAKGCKFSLTLQRAKDDQPRATQTQAWRPVM